MGVMLDCRHLEGVWVSAYSARVATAPVLVGVGGTRAADTIR